MDDLAQACQRYRMLVIAHRLRKFGFEPSINKLSSDDLRVLKGFLHAHQAAAIDREIAERSRIASEAVSGRIGHV
jgi:hypothetical protein